MKTKPTFLLFALAMLATINSLHAQSPVITSFSQNGILACSNLYPGSVAGVEWAPTLTGPWQSDWSSLSAIAVPTNHTISVPVPMFYRVRGNSSTTSGPPDMVSIPAGSFLMGDTLDGLWDAMPATNVYVSGFYMDSTLVTWNQWQSIANYATNNGYFLGTAAGGKATNHPVVAVNFYDCLKWSNARSQQEGLTPVYYNDAQFTLVITNSYVSNSIFANWAADGYRLPTEAEWEKAARGGLKEQRYPWGSFISFSKANYFSGNNTTFYKAGYDFEVGGYNPTFNDSAHPLTNPVKYFPPQWLWAVRHDGQCYRAMLGLVCGVTVSHRQPFSGRSRSERPGYRNYSYYTRCLLHPLCRLGWMRLSQRCLPAGLP